MSATIADLVAAAVMRKIEAAFQVSNSEARLTRGPQKRRVRDLGVEPAAEAREPTDAALRESGWMSSSLAKDGGFAPYWPGPPVLSRALPR